jgi:putative FmdB family regulatory protein
MPIYEYQCDSCDHKFEEIQRMSDDKLTICPECGEAALRKLISAAAFVLKGSGWYETDFKDSGKKKKEDSKSESSGDGTKSDGAGAKSDGKKDSKTATSSESKSSSSASSTTSSTSSSSKKD